MWVPRLPHPTHLLPISHASSSHAAAGCPAGERVRGRHHGRPRRGRALGTAPPQPRRRSRARSASRRKPGSGELPPATLPERSTTVASSPAGLASCALPDCSELPPASLPARAPRRRRAPPAMPPCLARGEHGVGAGGRRARSTELDLAPRGGRGMPFLPSCSAKIGRAPRSGRGTPFLPSSAPPSLVSPYAGGCSTSFPPSSALVKSSKFQHLAFSPATAT
jgi:hypothetical protein